MIWIKLIMLNLIASAASFSALFNVSTNSTFFFYQPEIPKEMSK